jgi:hypothetical protein
MPVRWCCLARAVLHVYERAGKLRFGEVEVGQEPRVLDQNPDQSVWR